MSGNRDPVQLSSDATAVVLTAMAALAFIIAGHRLLPERMARITASDRPFELSLQAAQPQAPPAPPPPVPRHMEKRQRVLQPAPAPPEPLPVEEQPAPADAALVAALAAPPAATATASKPDLEALYAAELLADINSRKHPPDSAQYRVLHPHGEVRVSFVLSRSGEARTVSVVRSSGSALLDDEARKLVASGRYPPMPEKCFVGETQHTFLVTIEYPPAHITRSLVASESVVA